MIMSIHRRYAILSVGALILAPRMGWAEEDACARLAKGLSLCPATGWTQDATVDGATANFVSTNGIIGAVRLQSDLTPEQVSGARSMILHAPISARASVLSTGFAEVDGQLATTVAYLPRHAHPATVVAMSRVIGDDFTLVVTTRETGIESYSETHQKAHAALLAALRLEKDR